MPMVCPQCNGIYDQQLNCPVCGIRLLYQAPTKRGGLLGGEHSWQQTPWGRIVIGILLAQGLYYGLRQLCLAGFLAAGAEAARSGDIGATLTGLSVLQGLQVLGVLAGAILAGTGKRRGPVYGLLVGLWNGALFTVCQNWLGQQGFIEPWLGRDWTDQTTLFNLLGPPILQAAVGLVGGWMGSMIWKPLPEFDLALTPQEKAVLATGPQRSLFAGPVAWGRVLAGSAIAIGGVVWVNAILDFVLEASEHKLTIQTFFQARLVTWEICSLAMLVGSSLAGANTLNGMKQGLWVGLVGFTVLFGIRMTSASVPDDLLMFTLLSALPLGLVGGWFGCQLFPPLPRRS